ncbi:MAG: hypothetical protein AAFO07_29915 [Bacteroidota bacterium]
MKFKKYFLISLILALSISALIGILIFILGDFNDLQIRILLSTLSVGAFSLTGFCCSLIYNREELQLLSIVGMLASSFALLLCVFTIWGEPNMDEFWKLLFISITLAIAFAHVSLMLLVRPKSVIVKYLLYATILFIILVSIFLISLVVVDEFENEVGWRILGVFGILDALGTVVTPIVNVVEKRKSEPL